MSLTTRFSRATPKYRKHKPPTFIFTNNYQQLISIRASVNIIVQQLSEYIILVGKTIKGIVIANVLFYVFT